MANGRNLLICGIDPGKSGGISYLTGSGKVHATFSMPETETEVVGIFQTHRERTGIVIIERLQPMFRTSKVTMFKLGRSYGFLRGVINALALPYDEVRPQAWQTYMGCLTKGDKAVSRGKAQQLWPATFKGLGIGASDAIADSLLIAEYGRRHKLLIR